MRFMVSSALVFHVITLMLVVVGHGRVLMAVHVLSKSIEDALSFTIFTVVDHLVASVASASALVLGLALRMLLVLFVLDLAHGFSLSKSHG